MEDQKSLNFIEEIIEHDIAHGKHAGRVHTRFPPEPNGYLHIGHAKAICLNFEIAKKYGGKTNLRFDDTNPATEETEYVNAIKRDIHWLGYDWEDREYYASDYFDQLYEYALDLIRKDLAFVDDSTAEEIAEQKGTPNEPGKLSPFRSRSVEENMDLFVRMKDGEFPDGARVLRVKVDMTAPNMHMRDPVIYRIKRQHHHRTGDKWCIYPMYDFAHGQSDSIEGITHSLCSLEFIHHRPLYEWFIEKLGIFPSRQIEFARMNVNFMITSKRRLLQLVNEGIVTGWDDPRMPTISGVRRRGYPAAAIRIFCEKVGIAKRDNWIEIELLESCVRNELNQTALRRMVVLDPIRVVITNYPEGQTELLPSENNPENESTGERDIPFGKVILIEREDFMLDPPKKYFRLAPGATVRLKSAYIITCQEVIKDETTGEVTEVHCNYYPDSKSGSDTSGIKAKGTLHWVHESSAISGEVRMFERLFTAENPMDEGSDFMSKVNPQSQKVIKNIRLEPAFADAVDGDSFQFIRHGYFTVDRDSKPGHLVFNQTVSLKEGWSPKE
ncbi:MAG: glutamine--tRNA ligase/YqeY domain fusion protein [Saprospiraceae bacterium]|uniref:Glutamine--tRNA ligase n=1 Tax=Candidatus Opimibacter skivensis TaxID=2982028 RepID=A0A9D7STJ8_9BACT|nr:glutamine--tRNA ligase/YqeY domain fusion protein [Candidatus Opimibacter skivensis]